MGGLIVAIVGQAIGLIALAVAIAYWGGQMHRSVDALLAEIPTLRATAVEHAVSKHQLEVLEDASRENRGVHGELFGRLQEMRIEIGELRGELHRNPSGRD